VRAAATRATRQRIEILALLLAAPRALSHLEIEYEVRRAPGMDRVTIYRVLDWLVAQSLAHRISGDDRVWRFNAVDGEHARQQHAHFKCNDCGKVTCLETALAARKVPLPAGYRPQEVELTVKGLCARCTRGA
jgi:Fur family ferric uptake transcriptional regulator